MFSFPKYILLSLISWPDPNSWIRQPEYFFSWIRLWLAFREPTRSRRRHWRMDAGRSRSQINSFVVAGVKSRNNVARSFISHASFYAGCSCRLFTAHVCDRPRADLHRDTTES